MTIIVGSREILDPQLFCELVSLYKRKTTADLAGRFGVGCETVPVLGKIEEVAFYLDVHQRRLELLVDGFIRIGGRQRREAQVDFLLRNVFDARPLPPRAVVALHP